MRRSLGFLIVLAACSGGGSPTSTPTPVASVSFNIASSSVVVGAALSLSVTLKDASGIALTGRTVTWSTSAANVASVSASGVVTGLAAGVATITATSEGKSASTTITVTAAGPSCTGVNPLSVAVGEVHTLTAAERQILCLPGGASGQEYLLVPFNSTTDTTLAKTAIPFSASASGTSATTGSPALSAVASRSGFQSLALGLPQRRIDRSFELRLRQRERAELGPLLRARTRTPGGTSALRSLRGGPAGRNAIVGLPSNPTVGTAVTLNANGNSACSGAINRPSRVAAVSNSAIVIVDNTAPAGGFTDAEYLSFATTFDTLVFPLDTTAFGAPWDVDGNGRVVIFFTPAVNALTPAVGASGIIGGFFFERDLFPPTAQAITSPAGTQTLPACAGSNFGEMFYVPVVDPAKTYNKYYTSKDTLKTDIIGTLAHEFQHLINASRRIYITVASVDDEEVWLSEGMSHIAEELLYYRVTALAPKQDLGYNAVVATQAKLDAMNSYQVDNLGRLSDYLLATDTNSPYAKNDSLATRGATWEILRYSLDQSPNANSTYLHALVDASTQGKPNFDIVFAGVGGLLGATRQQVIANFFDNSGITIAAQYAFPSWNYRDLLPHLNPGYPLKTKSLVPGATPTYSLVGGGAGYLRFRVGAGLTGTITAGSGGGALPTAVEMILIRTQ